MINFKTTLKFWLIGLSKKSICVAYTVYVENVLQNKCDSWNHLSRRWFALQFGYFQIRNTNQVTSQGRIIEHNCRRTLPNITWNCYGFSLAYGAFEQKSDLCNYFSKLWGHSKSYLVQSSQTVNPPMLRCHKLTVLRLWHSATISNDFYILVFSFDKSIP